jgi:predicted metalloprotease with PDZ domain
MQQRNHVFPNENTSALLVPLTTQINSKRIQHLTMALIQAYINENDIAVSQARMEEGLAHDSIPVASATICTSELLDNNVTETSVVALEHDSSIPMATASELITPHVLSSHQHQEDMERPALLSATVFKGSKDEIVGLRLANSAGGVIVSGLEQEGLLKVAPFEIGDRIMSVNSVSCEGMNAKGVATLIQKAEKIVTVVVRTPNGRADLVSSMIQKDRPETRVGVTLRTLRRTCRVVIDHIAEDGLVAHTLLNVGDTCLSINGIKITPNIDGKAAAALIRNSPDFVTIKAKTERETGVVVAVWKKARATNEPNFGYPCVLTLFIFTVIIFTIVARIFSWEI